MDSNQFDRFVRTFAGAASRRQVLGRLAGGAGGGLLGFLGVSSVVAQDDDDDDEGNGNRDRRRNRDNGNGTEQVEVETTAASSGAGGGQAQCRRPGDNCGPDQLCCDGLPCAAGKDGVTRCGGDAPVAACEGTCTATEVTLVRAPAYRVEVDCRYDDNDDRTTCDCVARGDEPVIRVSLGQADVCAEVVDGDFEIDAPRVRNTVTGGDGGSGGAGGDAVGGDGGNASAGTGGVANSSADGGQVTIGDVEGDNSVAIDASGGTSSADASGGDGNTADASGGDAVGGAGGDGGDSTTISNVAVASGARIAPRFITPRQRASDTLVMTFAGRVEPTGNATYWCETERGLVPADGPALTRVQETTAETGAIVVRALSCDVSGPPDDRNFNWYGECRRPAKAQVQLRAVQGGNAVEQASAITDDAGRRSFVQLAVGAYRVAPEGSDFCHAECADVDDNGDLVVEAGRQITVYLFHCGGRS